MECARLEPHAAQQIEGSYEEWVAQAHWSTPTKPEISSDEYVWSDDASNAFYATTDEDSLREWIDERPGDLLTAAEHQAMDMTARLWDHMVQNVIESGISAGGDCAELGVNIHAIQHTIMAQAAARAYPERYRRLGSEIGR